MVKPDLLKLHQLLGQLEFHVAHNQEGTSYPNWDDPRIKDIRVVEQIIESII